MAKTPTFAVKSLADFNRPAIDAEWYKHIDYQDAVDLIRDNIAKAAESFVGIGYYLRFVKEHQLYKDGGYNNIYDFASSEFGISQGTTSRYISMNERFSRNGYSPLLDDKFADFGKSQLQELLSVKDDETLTEVIENRSITPDMTVTEIRQSIKAANNQSKTAKLEKEVEEDIPGQMVIGEFPEYLPDERLNENSQDQEQGTEQKEGIIDGEYREIVEKNEEIVATSQSTDKGNDKPRKCITGMSKYGSCVCCGVDGIQCCAQCGEDCNNRCGWIPERSDKQETPDDELSKLRKLLDEKKKELDECAKINAVEPLPEGYVYERKTIVGALAGMLCELEDAAEQPEQESEQPELPLLKNNDQRKEWLAKYKDWGLWYHDEHIDVNYYKYDFNDGSRLVVTEYPQRHCYWKKGKEDQYYYHLLEKRYKGYGDIVYDRQYNNSTDSETYLVEFLKNLQKGDKKA